MNLRDAAPGDPVTEGYRTIYVSTDGLWFIGLKPVLFGVRVIAWRNDSTGPVVDYCAGADPIFMVDLLGTVAEIFRRHIPEGATEREVLSLMPQWERRPIDQDPSWLKLRAMAAS